MKMVRFSRTVRRAFASLVRPAVTAPATAVLVVLACSSAWAQSSAERMGLLGPVAEVEVHQEYPGTRDRVHVRTQRFDPEGTATETILWSHSFDGTLTGRTVMTFDDDGRTLTSVRYDAEDQPIGQTVYRYDDEGRLIEQVTHDAEGAETLRRTTTFDDAGNAVVEETYANGARTRRIERTFDGENRVTEERTVDGDGNLLEVETHTEPGRAYEWVRYDREGNVRFEGTVVEGPHGTERITGRNADGEPEEYEWRYDEQGRTVERRDVTGDLASVYTYTYEDDAHGNWIRQEVVEDRGSGPEPYEIIDRTIRYH